MRTEVNKIRLDVNFSVTKDAFDYASYYVVRQPV
jgi:hypothetical protein